MARPTPTEFFPKNLHKYIGKTPIIMRSSWETHFAKKLDNHPNVIAWASETVIIKYYNPVKQRKAQYHTDFVAEFINSSGESVIEVFEIKPHNEARPAMLLMKHQRHLLEDRHAIAPKEIASKARSARTRAYNDATTMVNAAKWLAAEDYCYKKGFVFKVLTEHQLFGKGKS